MRIAFLTTEYMTEPNWPGGLANYLYRLVQAESQRNHEVEVFTASDRDEFLMHDGIAVHRVNIRVPRPLNGLTLGRFRQSLHAILTSYRLCRRFLYRHQQTPFDIVQASQFRACGLLLALRSPIPLIIRLSSFEPQKREAIQRPLAWDQRLYEWLESFAIRKSDGVYSPGRLTAKFCEDKLGTRVDVIEPPFFLENQTRDDSVYTRMLAGKRYLMFVGAMSSLKGVHVLDEALRVVLPKCPEMHFVFVGRSSTKPALRALSEHPERVHYLGTLPHSQLYPIVAQSYGVVLPSLADNLPNACLEAMGLGCPVIGTRGTGLEELVQDGKSGFLVEPGDVQSLSSAILKMWRLPGAVRKEMGDLAKGYLKPFNPANACLKLENFFARHITRSEPVIGRSRIRLRF